MCSTISIGYSCFWSVYLFTVFCLCKHSFGVVYLHVFTQSSRRCNRHLRHTWAPSSFRPSENSQRMKRWLVSVTWRAHDLYWQCMMVYLVCMCTRLDALMEWNWSRGDIESEYDCRVVKQWYVVSVIIDVHTFVRWSNDFLQESYLCLQREILINERVIQLHEPSLPILPAFTTCHISIPP